jgi:hypothetical protein
MLLAERTAEVRAGVNFAGAAITWDRSPRIPERLRGRRAAYPVQMRS